MTEKLGLYRVRKVLDLPACCGTLKGKDGSYCALGKVLLAAGTYTGYFGEGNFHVLPPFDLSDEIVKLNNYSAKNAKRATHGNDYDVPYTLKEGKAFGPEKKAAWKRHIKATAQAFLNSKLNLTGPARKYLESLA